MSHSVNKHLHIALNGMSFSYGINRVLTDLSCAIGAGQVVGLIGENGAGKSTFMKLVAGELTPDHGGIVVPPNTGVLAQEVSYPPSAPLRSIIAQAIDELRAIEQDIIDTSEKLAAIPDDASVAQRFDELLALAEQHQVWTIDARVAEVLAGLGLAEVDLDAPISSVSGGQRRRLALAALLIRPVDAMILDEPTNHFDDMACDYLLDELDAFRGPVLVASHDRWFLDHAATGIIDLDYSLGAEGGRGEELQQGSVFSGSFSDYLAYRRRLREEWEHDYRIQEQQREKLEKGLTLGEEDLFHKYTAKAEFGAAKKFYADKASKVHGRQIQSTRSKLEHLERTEIPAPPKRLSFAGLPDYDRTTTTSPYAVVLRNITIPHRMTRPFSARIHHGEKVLLAGPNGAGKSSLLAAIAGALDVSDSSELIVGEDLRVGWLQQDDAWDSPFLSAAELYSQHVPTKAPSLTELGLLTEETANRPLEKLSLGQQRRVTIAMVLADPPDILLLDEPTNHISLTLTEELEQAIANFEGTVIMATHDRWVKRRWGGRVIELHAPAA